VEIISIDKNIAQLSALLVQIRIFSSYVAWWWGWAFYQERLATEGLERIERGLRKIKSRLRGLRGG
jgi:hypothetical protein